MANAAAFSLVISEMITITDTSKAFLWESAGLNSVAYQFADLGFQIVIRNDQRANDRPHITAARRIA
jgi:hypothetical protein